MNELLKSRGYKPRTGNVAICKICGKEFYVSPSRISVKYCSYKCSYEGRKNKERRVCSFCNKIIERPRSYFKWGEIRKFKNFYCSEKCHSMGLSRKNKGKIISKIWLMRRADIMFSDYIRNRDNWTCRYCNKNFWGKSGQLHNSHFWSRKNWSTRYDPKNCIALCYSCHLWKLEKEKQGIYRQIMIDWLGEKEFELLEQRANTIMAKRDSILAFMKWVKPFLKEMKIPRQCHVWQMPPLQKTRDDRK